MDRRVPINLSLNSAAKQRHRKARHGSAEEREATTGVRVSGRHPSPGHKIHPASPDALRPGNRRRRAVITASSARVKTISSGENPRRHANHNVIANNSTVIATFAQEFTLYCPRHANCTDEKNGARYGIGHW